MNGDELKAAAIMRFGEKRYQKDLANFLGSDVSSIRRWISGKTAVPGPVAAAMKVKPSS